MKKKYSNSFNSNKLELGNYHKKRKLIKIKAL